MIYGHIIREQQLTNLIKSSLEIMEEYYKNEISILNSILEYNQSVNINESSIEVIREGFIENVKNKIKEIISNFIQFCKNFINKFIPASKTKNDEAKEKCKKHKEKIKNIKTNTNNSNNSDKDTEIAQLLNLVRNDFLKIENSGDNYTITTYDALKYVEDANKYLDEFDKIFKILSNGEDCTTYILKNKNVSNDDSKINDLTSYIEEISTELSRIKELNIIKENNNYIKEIKCNKNNIFDTITKQMDENIAAQYSFDRWNQFTIHTIKQTITELENDINNLKRNNDISDKNIVLIQRFKNIEITIYNLYLEKISKILSTSVRMTLK